MPPPDSKYGLTHKAAFLGPRGENAAEMEQLLLDVLRDHVYWRRNFHPEDPRLIREDERSDPAFTHTYARLRDELFQILAQLKRAAPLHSPRQVAHIVSDPSLPALVGYFAGMLYNQNNVVQEVAPETVRRERDYVAALAQMVGYPDLLGDRIDPTPQKADGAPRRTVSSWGHLCSGGTAANMEAVWTARNLRFFPLALRLLVKEKKTFANLGEESVTLHGETVPFTELSTPHLFDLPVGEVIRLHQAIKGKLSTRAKAFENDLRSVQQWGLVPFIREYNKAFPGEGEEVERLPAVLISVASHYSWKKAMDLVGLGARALVEVDVDQRIRLDAQDLRSHLARLRREGRPVLMVVSVCGTTEEAAVDPLHEVHRLQRDPELPGFWHHCDAALGGFFATLLPRDARGEPKPFQQLAASDKKWLDENVYDALCALRHADSMALDPHKFGYVPYPCGAVLFRDHPVRDFIAYEAPYLAGDRQAGFGGFLGKYTLEGSRPGAAAVSCYLSQAVLPLTRAGHGHLIASCVQATQALFEKLRDAFDQPQSRLAFCPFNEKPDTTGICFALIPRHEALSLEDINAFNKDVWDTMTVKEDRLNAGEYDFLISQSEVKAHKYAHVLERMFRSTSLAQRTSRTTLTESSDAAFLLRVFVLNPFLQEWIDPPSESEVRESFAAAFSRHVYAEAHRLLPPFLLSHFHKRQERRLRVLVVEDEDSAAASITKTIRSEEEFSRYLDAQVYNPQKDDEAPRWGDWDKVVLDLQLHPGDGLDLSGLREAKRLLAHGFTPPQLVVYSRFAGIKQVREELEVLGLRPDQIIEKPDPRDRAEQSTRLSNLLESLVTGVFTADAEGATR